MDNAKAIQVLTNFVKFFETMISRTNCKVPDSSLKMITACTFAVAALGKRIPKPVKYNNRHGDGADYWNRDYFNCPACGRRLRNKKPDPYCPQCGQALTWGR